MIELEDKALNIVDLYMDRIFNTDKTVGLIANKEIAEYLVEELLGLEYTSAKEIDFVDYFDLDEYLVAVDCDGYITAIPIEDFVVLEDVDIVYIDMDGDIPQDVIDYCVDEDKTVILFGEKEDDEDRQPIVKKSTSSHCYVNGKEVTKAEYDKANKEIENFLEFVRKVYGF